MTFELFQKIMNYLNVFVFGFAGGVWFMGWKIKRKIIKRSTPPPGDLMKSVLENLKARGIDVQVMPDPFCNCDACRARRKTSEVCPVHPNVVGWCPECDPNPGGQRVLH